MCWKRIRASGIHHSWVEANSSLDQVVLGRPLRRVLRWGAYVGPGAGPRANSPQATWGGPVTPSISLGPHPGRTGQRCGLGAPTASGAPNMSTLQLALAVALLTSPPDSRQFADAPAVFRFAAPNLKWSPPEHSRTAPGETRRRRRYKAGRLPRRTQGPFKAAGRSWSKAARWLG